MNAIPIHTDDCAAFPGGYSLNADEMETALSAVRYEGMLRVIEFGAGASTQVLHDLLVRKDVLFEYVVYENNPEYYPGAAGVSLVAWKEFPTELRGGVFDLVIIDGPNGTDRAKWCPLLRGHVREGTIIVFDDFHHFRPVFEKALKELCRYGVIDEVNQSVPRSWLTAKVIEC